MRSAANNHLLQLDYNGLTCVTVIQNASLRSGISKRGTDNYTQFRTQQTERKSLVRAGYSLRGL